MGKILLISEPPISKVDAKKLGRFLADFAITIGGLRVTFCTERGGCKQARPVTDTIMEAAGGAAAGIVAAPAMAPVAVPVAAALTTVLGPFTIPVLLATLGGEVAAMKAIHDSEVPLKIGGEPVIRSEVEFEFRDVGPDRRTWAETLVCIHAINGGMEMWGVGDDAKAAAARFISNHGVGSYPVAWKRQPKGYRRRKAPQAAGDAKRKAATWLDWFQW